jgi:hypothetical protein
MAKRILKPKTEEDLKKLEQNYYKRGYRNLSGGPMTLMNLDKKWYKGVTAIIIKYPKRKNYFMYYVQEKSFFKHGHRWG